MTSYLRSIFSAGPNQPIPVQKAQSTQSHGSHRSKSHSRSYSSPSVNAAAANYIYSTPSAGSSRSPSRPTTKRSQSFSARTKAPSPSPLRYGYESAASYAASDDGKHGRKRSPLQRSSSYKTSNHCTLLTCCDVCQVINIFIQLADHTLLMCHHQAILALAQIQALPSCQEPLGPARAR